MKKIIFIIAAISILLTISAEQWVGKAATYQKKTGTKTANGEAFDGEGLYAASNGFKLGAEIKIRNIKDSREISVIVNDRIEENSDYFILLTPKASRDLNMEWQTDIVIVNAEYSAVNSVDKLDINGVIAEGEIDVETLKKFPNIDVKDIIKDDKKDITMRNDFEKPVIENDTLKPLKEEKNVIMDYDEKSGIKTTEIKDNILPEKEKFFDPEKIDKDYKIDADLLNKKDGTTVVLIVPEKENSLTPESKNKTAAIDNDIDINKIINETTDQKTINKDIIETVKKDDIKKDNKEVISWDNKLLSGKIYLRFSTTYEKEEAERRVQIFRTIFKDTVWIKDNNKFILYLGPVERSDIDDKINMIRSYGFKDAYMIKVK